MSKEITDAVRQVIGAPDKDADGNAKEARAREHILRDYFNWKSAWLFWFVPVLMACMTSFNTDDFFIVNIGRWILRNGLYNNEPFTSHANMTWIPQQFMSDIVYYLSYLSDGFKGLVILAALVFFLTVFIWYRTMRIYGGARSLCTVSVAVLSLAMIGFTTSRPWIFSALFMSIEMYLLTKWRSGRRRYAYFIPLTVFALTNFHMTMYPIAIILMLPYLAGSFRLPGIMGCSISTGAPKKELFISFLLSISAGFANPYGAAGALSVFRSNSPLINRTVKEMLPSWKGGSEGIALMIFAVFMLGLFLRYRRKGDSLTSFLLLSGTTLMGVLHIRLFLIMLLCCPAVMSDIICPVKKDSSMTKTRGVLVAAAGIAAIVLFISSEKMTFVDKGLEEAVETVIADEGDNRGAAVYTGYVNGSYCEWMGLKCGMDARAEVFLKSLNGSYDYFDEWAAAKFDGTDIQGYLDRNRFAYAITDSEDGKIQEYISVHPQWKKLCSKDGYTAWVHLA